MTAGRFQEFFGDDWEDAFDSIKSAPGAFGNLFIAALRQIRLIDAIGIGLVVTGWLWLVIGFGIAGNDSAALVLLALLPTFIWIAAGAIGGLIFEIGGIGVRALAYWESYLLILLFAAFGLISLRIALNPRDRYVYRSPAKPEQN